jgi:hypothetical protein
MTIDLTRDEIWLLKALRAAGTRGRIVSAQASHAALTRLVEVQFVTTHVVRYHWSRPTRSSECTAIDERESKIDDVA